MLIDQLVENGQRRDFHDLEKLEIYQQLLKLNGWTPKQLAEALRVSEGQVSRVLTLKRLCPEVQDWVRAGRLRGSLAYHVARVGNPDTQKTLARQVLDGMTREVLEVRVRELLRGGPKRPAKSPAIVVRYAGLDATEKALLAEAEEIRAARRKGFSDDDYATKLRNRKEGR
jgi:ParB family chromosome partitioning protein